MPSLVKVTDLLEYFAGNKYPLLVKSFNTSKEYPFQSSFYIPNTR